MRVIAVDHGEKRIGLAVSDPTGTLARPFSVIQHTARQDDAKRVIEVAKGQGAELIIVGQSFDEEGRPNAAGRRAARFAEALKAASPVPVVLWDESFSTQDARSRRLAAGTSKKARRTPVDAEAAAMILDSYLEAHRSGTAGLGKEGDIS